MSKFIIVLFAVLPIAAPAFALPDYEQHTYYYDSAGNVIGEQSLLCNYPYDVFSGDIFGDNYTTEVGPSCNQFQGIDCQGLGLVSIPYCPTCSWCVSESYVISFYEGTVMDRNGNYCSEQGYGHACNARAPLPKKKAPRQLLAVLRRTLATVVGDGG